MFFVMKYDERAARMLVLEEFEGRVEAMARLNELEASPGPVPATIVMFSARDKRQLKSTHGRYFIKRPRGGRSGVVDGIGDGREMEDVERQLSAVRA